MERINHVVEEEEEEKPKSGRPRGSAVLDPLSSFLSARGHVRPSSLRAIESAHTRPPFRSFRSLFRSLGRPPVGKICSRFRFVEAAYTCREIINLRPPPPLHPPLPFRRSMLLCVARNKGSPRRRILWKIFIFNEMKRVQCLAKEIRLI